MIRISGRLIKPRSLSAALGFDDDILTSLLLRWVMPGLLEAEDRACCSSGCWVETVEVHGRKPNAGRASKGATRKIRERRLLCGDMLVDGTILTSVRTALHPASVPLHLSVHCCAILF